MGRLVLVVGPSGAGKDTVLNEARRRLAGRADVVFPRRVITRPTDATEDHEAVDEAAFARRRFLLRWSAHGLHYGIPASAATDLAAGRVVIVNVSRAIVAAARRDHDCTVIGITAPAAILAARLAARGRESEAEIAERLARAAPGPVADAVIVNDATPDAAGAAFVAALAQCVAGFSPA